MDPKNFSSPSFKSKTLSATSSTSSMSWVTNIIELPSLLKFLMTLIRSWSPLSSSPVFGSSRTRYFGFIAKMHAIASLCFSPPLSSNGFLFSNPLSPTASRAHLTLFLTSSSLRPKFFGPKATSLKTFSSKNIASGFWNT
ncbi:139aa long hypothetical protein [Pyrococcus horikoshii OT3]|uniref:Uncharacterized protein n=1 Tax=Pyrococcus horikoshii (strain ATCC 700860 / DSM 12428 / JCM 9974 / NBRC 100139 / OT-3) TaxID=70601 RepID=O57873_PYRHO|nr:139aa long hypothetical protein [Pyrococcus horikoshii OT3]